MILLVQVLVLIVDAIDCLVMDRLLNYYVSTLFLNRLDYNYEATRDNLEQNQELDCYQTDYSIDYLVGSMVQVKNVIGSKN